MNKVGVIGFPIGHSLSPIMHNAAFRALGMTDWVYDAMEIPPDIVAYGVKEPQRHGYIGINVTVPHKQAVMAMCRPDEKAKVIGAVNTIDFRDDTGTNTDADGFIGDLYAHDVTLENETVLVLGAGGAARAAVYGLGKVGANVIIVNRTSKRAQELQMDMQALAGFKTISTMPLTQAIEHPINLIVNCTSVGMHPNSEVSPWQDTLPFPKDCTIYDMVYRPRQTKLLQDAEAQGCRTIGGLGMLVRQGAIAFELWAGREAPIEVMMDAVEKALSIK